MERCFIATKESKYFKDCEEYFKKAEKQSNFVKRFFNEKGIEGSKYIVGGNGCVNVPFSDFEKSKIGIKIESTENNLNKFNKMLCKPDKYNLRQFKKNSKVSKEFAQKCVDEEIVINLYQPRIGDYFDSLGFNGYSYQRLYNDEQYYIKIESEYLKEDEILNGFIEIKDSEFYIMKENLENDKSNNK